MLLGCRNVIEFYILIMSNNLAKLISIYRWFGVSVDNSNWIMAFISNPCFFFLLCRISSTILIRSNSSRHFNLVFFLTSLMLHHKIWCSRCSFSCFLQILYYQICLPKINIQGIFKVICGHCVEWWKNWVTQGTCSQLRLNKTMLCFLFQLSYYKQLSFLDLFS